MNVDYNDYAETFSNSRKNMKWEEIEYFLFFLEGREDLKILDVGCGSGRLIGELEKYDLDIVDYLGIDLSVGLLDEAKKNYPNHKFIDLNMQDLNKIDHNYNVIFFVASFHHINSIEDRIRILKKAYKKLESGGIVFFTNWALESELNKNRYSISKVKGSTNDYGSSDFNIKIGEFVRYYHSFALDELKYLFESAGFQIIENREFGNKRNIISIIKK